MIVVVMTNCVFLNKLTVDLLVPKLLDDEEFDFDLPVSPVHSER